MRTDSQAKVALRVKRIVGQISAVQRMIEEDRYCVDVLNQISAVRAALDALGIELLTNHLESCVVGQGTGTEHPRAKPMKRKQLLAELQTVLTRFLR
jgi:CsoR family transcriptional regulator, copper-sensing transcriptional repressor